jgi:hypothetical protein
VFVFFLEKKEIFMSNQNKKAIQGIVELNDEMLESITGGVATTTTTTTTTRPTTTTTTHPTTTITAHQKNVLGVDLSHLTHQGDVLQAELTQLTHLEDVLKTDLTKLNPQTTAAKPSTTLPKK